MIELAVCASLLLFLAAARVHDSWRRRRVLEGWDVVRLSASGERQLAWLVEPINDHRYGVQVCTAALAAENVERLRLGVGTIEALAPSVGAGLAAIGYLARATSAVVPLPPVRPLVWRSIELRGLAGFVALLHAFVVTAGEQIWLRCWLLTRALRMSVRWLGAAARPARPEWERARRIVSDLQVVGDEAEITYERVVRSLDLLGALGTSAGHV